MEPFTLLCKVCSGIILSDRIILKIAVLVSMHKVKSRTSFTEI